MKTCIILVQTFQSLVGIALIKTELNEQQLNTPVMLPFDSQLSTRLSNDTMRQREDDSRSYLLVGHHQLTNSLKRIDS
mgnify:CR=1 FL=1